MQPDLMWKLALDLADFQHFGQELTEFQCAFANSCRTFIVMIAQMIVMIANHRNATARWSDDIIITVEHIDKLLRQRLCFFHATAVGHRLAAACLVSREDDFNAEMFQHRNRCHADMRIELIDVTRNEQGNFHEFTIAGQRWMDFTAGAQFSNGLEPFVPIAVQLSH